MATSNRTHFAILGFLTHGPMSGYDIKKQIDESVENFWSESFGQLYPALRRLTEEGLIEKAEAPSEGGRRRNVYSINDRGREALDGWLHEPTPPAPVRIELLLKLFFGARNDRATNRRQILTYRKQMVDDLERYRSITEFLCRDETKADELPYWLMTLRFGERDREAHIEWCDEALVVLENLPDTDSTGDADDNGERENKRKGNSRWLASTRTGT